MELPRHVIPLASSAGMPDPSVPAARPVGPQGIALTIIMALAVMLALQWARPFLVPVLFGILISYALDPMVKRLVGWRVPHGIAATLVFVSVTALVGALGYSLSQQAAALTDKLPTAAQELRQALQARWAGETGPVEKVQQAAEELQKISGPSAAATPSRGRVTTFAIERKPFDIGGYLWAGSLSLTTFIADTAVVLFLVLYLLLAGDLFRRRFVEIAGPTLSQKKITLQILNAISEQISRYLFVRLLISGMVAAATFFVFAMIGLGQAGVWGVAAGLLNVVPYLGPAILALAAAGAAFLQFHTLAMALLTAGLAIGVATLEAYVITPWLMSRTAEMNPATVFIGLVFWGWLWGLPGLFLAVPIIMVVKSVCDHVEPFQPLATLLKR